MSMQHEKVCAPTTILPAIDASIERYAEKTAIRFEGTDVSYAELGRAACAVERRLNARGVATGDTVAVMAHRSATLPIVLLGIVRSGAAYLPLDPDYPPARIAQMLEDAQPALTLVDIGLRESLPQTTHQVVEIESLEPFEGTEAYVPARAIEASRPAYVIFTSGSTGRPKGVVNTHAGLGNRLGWMQDTFELTTGDRVMQKTPYGFDVSVWEFFWPFIAGAAMVVARPGGHRDPGYLASLVEREGVTVMHFVPSMLAVFLDQCALEERCRSLRAVAVSGEVLSPTLQAAFFEKLGHCELYNLYGPTEAAIDVTKWRCTPDPDATTVPIGHAVANTTIHLLDEHLNPVRQGEPGEIFIGGVQVALGYLNRPELTAERFLPDRFSSETNAKLYRTGDLGRVRDDGAIEFLGRIDHQFKLRGNRIEPGEIECRLEELPCVKRAVVAPVGEPGRQDLAAWCQMSDGGTFDAAAVRAALGEVLPDYMVPRHFMTVSEFPVTPNGKLDRAALPEPVAAQVPAGAPPRDDLEKFIAAEWEILLGLEGIPRDAPFFELGGSSLTAARFVNRMQEALGEFIYIVTLFDSPTIESYASLLKRDYGGAVAARFPNVRLCAARRGRTSPVDDDAIARFVRCVPALSVKHLRTHAERNPRAMFVLAPPRSGTTLLRVMLAGHPGLFAASELQLLCFATMREREAACSGKFALWLEGAVRAVMQLKQCDAEAAKSLLGEMTLRDISTSECFRLLQEWAAPRMLVDKSPSYALDPAALARAEADFAEPLYLHLTRHPLSVIDSFVSYHMDQVLFLRPHDFGPSELGELVWTVSHRNILDFLESIPGKRHLQIAFEDLVTDPEGQMRRLCEQFGIAYEPEMVSPYTNVETKMTDGLYQESTPMGDTRFLERQAIDPGAADRWRSVELDHALGAHTEALARVFGYGIPDGAGALERRRRDARRRQRMRRRT